MAGKPFDKSKPPSRHVTAGPSRASRRAALHATNMHRSGVLKKCALQVGPARTGAVTLPGGAEEIVCYADI